MHLSSDNTFFLECSDSLRADLHFNLFPVHYNSLGLQVWFPDFFGMALRKADVASELFAFTGDFTYVHDISLWIQGKSISVFTVLVKELLQVY